MRAAFAAARQDPPQSMEPRPDPLKELRDDARYHGERLALYRAKVMGPRPTSPSRLRELEQAHERAAARLAHAVRTHQTPNA